MTSPAPLAQAWPFVHPSIAAAALAGLSGLPACTQPAALALLRALVLALVANQAAFMISPKGKES